MKIRICFIAVLLFSTSFTCGIQHLSIFPGPGPGSHQGNIFSNYSPSSTYVGIFPGYRQGTGFRSYHTGFSGSAFARMGNERDYYGGGYNYYRGVYNSYPPLHFQMWNAGWHRGRYAQKSLYTSENFVEEWKNRPPQTSIVNGEDSLDLEDSPILSAGMSEEEVVLLLGAPLKKITFEGREVWKYSSFSLIFDDGLLTELR